MMMSELVSALHTAIVGVDTPAANAAMLTFNTIEPDGVTLTLRHNGNFSGTVIADGEATCAHLYKTSPRKLLHISVFSTSRFPQLGIEG